MRSRSICSKPAPTCARFNCYSGIGVSKPPRGICASRRRRSARPRVPSTCSHVRCRPRRRPPRRPPADARSVDRPTPEVANIFRRYGDPYRDAAGPALSTAHRRVMAAIETCRTAALGGHVEQCDTCGHQRIAYNSCRNRHCPKCQSLARAAWIEQRMAELLDCEYFHVVFTVPAPIAAIALQNRRVVYRILFSRHGRDPPDHRGGSPASRRTHRILRRAAHVGPDVDPSSASALRRAGRRSLVRWHPLDRLPARILSPRPGAVAPLSPNYFWKQLEAAFTAGTPEPDRHAPRPPRSRRLGTRARTCAPHRVGRVRQAALCGAPASTGLRRPIHASRRHLE
jgi:hypothetical protein